MASALTAIRDAGIMVKISIAKALQRCSETFEKNSAPRGAHLRNIWPTKHDATLRLWRYFKPARFVELLASGRIHFASARQFTDRFEGAVAVLAPDLPIDQRYQELSHEDRAFEELRRLTMISCWHIEREESAAMWNQYADDGKGIALSTTFGRLRRSCRPYFAPNALLPEDTWCGRVRYVNLLEQRLHPTDRERFFYKHHVFASEKEFRLVISLAMATGSRS